jgi:predicted 2-oxoglutarate/Fe(II)-dependent dioxygenase YbiX
MESKVPHLSSYITLINDFVPVDFCNSLIEECKDSEEWEWAKVGSTGREDFERRKVKQLRISNSYKDSFYDNKIFEYVMTAANTYNQILQSRGLPIANVNEDEGYNLLNYKKGYYFNEHIDEGYRLGRILTCVINLSDSHEGGNFCFFNGQIKIKLKAGDVILFPSNFMFPHSVSEFTDGERYSIVTWLK